MECEGKTGDGEGEKDELRGRVGEIGEEEEV